eukprot:CAMPEP_0180172526 /NCGR_PEP_ID=MMETSP0986-20121125/35079_1 /TAXON_ID=697907 /ORGANISM="non described non described, Strain CCMP2293" /LENGTH=116 /DNA_ID=CAMNT_0022124633 /DNA_START=1 /DNA_END=351 /DNA_ORIENTATION=+
MAMIGIFAAEGEHLLSMALSPPGTGKPITGEFNALSGDYLYVGTSAGSLAAMDRRPIAGERAHRVVLVKPAFSEPRGGGKIASLLALPWDKSFGGAGKVVVIGLSSGRLETWLPEI